MAGVVQAELVQNFVEFVMEGHSKRAFEHVGAQVNPLFVVLFNHIKDNFLTISIIRVNVSTELSPGDNSFGLCCRESVLLIIVKIEFLGRSSAIRNISVARLLFSDQRL